MTISATRRFIDIIGEERLEKGACKGEPLAIGYGGARVLDPYLSGKEDFILAALHEGTVFINPHLYGSVAYWAYRSGAGIECADLQDIKRICK